MTADRHELVERFKDTDRAGYVTVTDLALMADMCEERLAHGATDRGLTLRKGGSHVPGISFFDDGSVFKLEQDAPPPRRVARWQWLRGDLIDRVPAQAQRGQEFPSGARSSRHRTASRPWYRRADRR